MSRGVSDSRRQSSFDLAAQLAASPELPAVLQAERAAFAQRIANLEMERDHLRAAHERLRQELEVFKRCLFIAKAERVDTKQLEMEFAEKMRALDAIAGTLGVADGGTQEDADDDTKARDGKKRGKRKKNRGTSRRDLRELPLDVERIEISDPHLEQLVAHGPAHYHAERNHQGLANTRIDPPNDRATGRVVRNERIGGVLNHYYREAARTR